MMPKLIFTLGLACLLYPPIRSAEPENSNAIDLNYFVSNEGSKKDPIILIHGWTGAWQTWLPIFPFLKDYPVYAIDLRGHGHSELGNFEFSGEQMVADLHKFVRKHNLKKITLIGASMGGRVASAYTVKHTKRIAKLVLVDSDITPRATLPITPETTQALERLKDFPREYESHQAAKTALFQLGIPPGEQNAKVLPEGEKWRLTFHPYAKEMSYRQLLVSNFGHISFAALIANQIPTLLVQAEDSIVYTDDLIEMLTLLPRMQHTQIKNTGHRVHADNPTAFSQIILKFIRHKKPVYPTDMPTLQAKLACEQLALRNAFEKLGI